MLVLLIFGALIEYVKFFQDIFGIALAPRTCANIDEQLFANIETFRVGIERNRDS
jgi:hypothetical protein